MNNVLLSEEVSMVDREEMEYNTLSMHVGLFVIQTRMVQPSLQS